MARRRWCSPGASSSRHGGPYHRPWWRLPVGALDKARTDMSPSLRCSPADLLLLAAVAAAELLQPLPAP